LKTKIDIAIREAGLKDSTAIVQLIAELAATGGEHSPLMEAYVEKYLSFPASKVLLAEARGQVVGLLSYSIRPDLYHAGNSCLIEELIVHETFRGQGVGSALMTELFTRLADEDCVEVSVTTMADNTPAIQFYRSQGLTDDAVYLEKHFQLDTGGT
jgi:hypothetical protein